MACWCGKEACWPWFEIANLLDVSLGKLADFCSSVSPFENGGYHSNYLTGLLMKIKQHVCKCAWRLAQYQTPCKGSVILPSKC